jgi:hypothetical protein
MVLAIEKSTGRNKEQSFHVAEATGAVSSPRIIIKENFKISWLTPTYSKMFCFAPDKKKQSLLFTHGEVFSWYFLFWKCIVSLNGMMIIIQKNEQLQALEGS